MGKGKTMEETRKMVLLVWAGYSDTLLYSFRGQTDEQIKAKIAYLKGLPPTWGGRRRYTWDVYWDM